MESVREHEDMQRKHVIRFIDSGRVLILDWFNFYFCMSYNVDYTNCAERDALHQIESSFLTHENVDSACAFLGIELDPYPIY